jgi:hypothetical protein
MQFNELLRGGKIDLKTLLIFRHRPKEPLLRKALPWLANNRHDIYNAYQQTQTPKVEKAMHRRARFLASFIGHEPGKALFVGLYEVAGSTPLSFDDFWNVAANVELKKFGLKGMTDESVPVRWFNLLPMEFGAEWKGKLIVNWSGQERNWWRWADKNEFPIDATVEDSILDNELAEWNQLTAVEGLRASTPPTQKAVDLTEPAPHRILTYSYRILRDTELARHVKVLHRFECQVCGHSIVLPDGSRYAEAHHIQPLGDPHNGPDIIGNIVCVCPNHHAELDYGVFAIQLSVFRHADGHSIDSKYVEYHNRLVHIIKTT